MGEWSEYFEDFPEENPANWINGRCDPALRLRLNKQNRDRDAEQGMANAEVNILIARSKALAKSKSKSNVSNDIERPVLLVTEDCPQCGEKELNTYKISDEHYRCECQECKIYGSGKTHQEALQATEEALGEGLDWSEDSLYLAELSRLR